MEEGGRVLRQYREAAGDSQQRLAVALDVSIGMVWKWEHGKNVPERWRAEQIDEHYQAGGEILRAFGYVKPGDGRVEELEHLVAELSDEVRTLAAQVVALTDVVRGRRRSGRDGS